MKRYVLLTLSLAAAVSACSLRMKSPDLIEETVPQRAGKVLERGTSPSITFSRKMEKSSVRGALCVSGTRGELPGEWSWDGRRVEFSSYNRYEESVPYRLELRGSVHDARGAAHRLSRSIPFFVSQGKRREVEILRTEPAGGGTLPSPLSPITVEFSEAMDLDSLEHALRVYPEAGIRIFPGESGCTYRITPAEPGWIPGRVYRLCIDTTAVSAGGLQLGAESERVYYAEAAARLLPPPTVSTVRIEQPPPFPEVSPGLEELREGESFRVAYSRPVNEESVEFAFRISPFWAGSLHWLDSSTCVFLPEPGESCTPGSTYRILIGEEARARDGGRMAEAFSIQFRAAAQPAPSILHGLPEDGFPVTLPHDSPIRISPSGILGTYSLSCEFDTPVESLEERKRLQTAVRVLPVFPPDIGYPEVIHLLWPDERTLVCQLEGLGTAARGRQCYYSLRLSPEAEVMLECSDE